jgi:hypothetical protein
MIDKARVIKSVCDALSSDDLLAAADIARHQYPLLNQPPAARNYSEGQALVIFLRDGFVDRYSGNRLVFPAVLRILSVLLPDEFPFHRNWKMIETHPAYWELFPTLDHVVPIARGGQDNETNLVSTSMLRNSAKANWTLEELGWSLHPPGSLSEWDGLLAWFLGFAEADKRVLKDKYISRWRRAALSRTRG